MKNSIQYKWITQIVCLFFLGMFTFPLVLMVCKSFEVGGWENYRVVFDYYNLFLNLATSLATVGGTLLLVGGFASMAAFAFSKLEFPGRRTLYYVLLSGLMIPTSGLIFPLYQIVRGLHINNTPLALIFPYATLNCCFNLMVLKNYYDSLPNEMMDAAKIDGASLWDVFRLVLLPMAKPGLVFVLIQTFLSAWNELQMAMIFINNTKIQPLSVIPIRFMQTQSVSGFTEPVMYAALVICLLPIAIFYVAASKNLTEGMVAGAIKG